MRAIKAALLALALTLFALPAWAWTETQKATALSGTPTTTTAAVNIPQNDLIVVTGSVRGTSAGTITVTDLALNSYTVYTCQQSTNNSYGFIAWATATTALSSQTIAEAFSGTVTSQAIAVLDISGQASSSPEDTAARACAFNVSAVTNPSVTSGAPANSGDLFISAYALFVSTSGLSISSSWNPSGGYGTGNTSNGGWNFYLNPGGSSAQTNTMTTTSHPYTFPVTAFKASGSPLQHQIMQSVP